MVYVPLMLTILRILLTPVILWVLCMQHQSMILIALGLFTSAVVTDFLDGFFARRWGVTSQLGSFLDPLADKLLLWPLLGIFAFWGLYPVFILYAILIRDFLVTLVRIRGSQHEKPLITSKAGKLKTCIQYLLVYFGFFSIYLRGAGHTMLHVLLKNGLVMVSGLLLFLTIVSGFQYLNQFFQDKKWFKKLAFLIATVGGIGYAPVMPGTLGALVGLLLCSVIPTDLIGWIMLCLYALGVWASDLICNIDNKEDPSYIIIDEVVGMLFLFVCWTPYMHVFSTKALLLNPVLWILFGLFRFFDIKKPWPIIWFEQFPGGYGVMVDDLAAGFVAFLVFWVWHLVPVSGFPLF